MCKDMEETEKGIRVCERTLWCVKDWRRLWRAHDLTAKDRAQGVSEGQ